MKRIFTLFVLASFSLSCLTNDIFACTSAIVTGKLTPDGRPLLWKHRDTGELNNRMEYFKGEKYSFLGLVNSPVDGGEVWTGTNEVGFSIMNTASYNLKDDKIELMDKEGELMYKALATCKTLKDFEKMLDKYPRPMRVEANFGVIDAEGGAAYYEVNNNKWTKLDVNDQKVAPHGFLVVTNYSYTGRHNEGMGYIRYSTAQKIMLEKSVHGDITPLWIFNELSRSFYHSLMDIDLRKDLDKLGGSGWFIDQDFIPRKSTSASIVVQGVKKGEDPLNTIMWTILGYPPVGVVVPLFMKNKANQPAFMLKSENSKNSEICDEVLRIKKQVFSLKRGNGGRYFNAALLVDTKDGSISQYNRPEEKQIFNDLQPLIEEWRKGPVDNRKLDVIYQRILELLY